MVKTNRSMDTPLMEAQEERIHGLQQKVQELTQTVTEMQQTIDEMQKMRLAEKKEPYLFICKVRLPTFNGEDPHGWLYKAELYFRLNETPPAKKLDVAEICMEGSAAVNWFKHLQRNYPQINWSDFKKQLIDRFSGIENPYDELIGLKQEQGSVEEYLEKFERIAGMIPEIAGDLYVSFFKCGLRDEIKHWVRMFSVTREKEKMSVQAVISLARRAEVWMQNRNDENGGAEEEAAAGE